MREILFRGKRTDKWDRGEWAEGLLDVFEGNPFILFNYDDPYTYHRVEVDPATVGQYTGLKDKNGNRIFEGDIVKSEFTKKPYNVCFGEYTYTNEYGEEESACGWYTEEEGGYVAALGSPDAWATVIGNVHDNPELLGEVY